MKKNKLLNIAVLSRGPDLYSTKRLVEAGSALGHNIEVINTLRCYMDISQDMPSVHYKGAPMKSFDAIIPRIGSKTTFYGSALVRQFETMGVFSLNPSIAITRARDKLRSLQLLSRKGIPMPKTGFAHSPDDIKDLIEMVGGVPLIIKILEGTQGVGVVLAETKKAAESVIQAFFGLKVNIIVQEYIKEAKGADIRCIVLGKKVIASMKRQAIPGEFRSNLHQGGSAEIIRISKEEREIAINAVKVMGLNFAGVDLLRSDRGPLVMEVNSSPGLEGIELATEKDVAKMVIEHIERHAKPISSRSKYQG